MTQNAQTTCPKCSGTMTLTYKRNIPLATCLACRGLWFSSQALQVLLERNDAPEAAGRVMQLEQMFQQPSTFSCPGCQGRLMTTWIAEVEVEFCPTCRGVYLDAGELKKVQWRDHTLETFGRTDPKKHDRAVERIARSLDGPEDPVDAILEVLGGLFTKKKRR